MNPDRARQNTSFYRFRTSLLASLVTVFAAVSALLGTAPTAVAAGSPPGLAKSYTGSARNTTAAESGAITLSGVTQQGSSIRGTLSFHAPLTGTGPFSGTITANTVNFTVKPTTASCAACASIVFIGTVWPIVSMSGTWVANIKSGGTQGGVWALPSVWHGPIYNKQANDTSDVTWTLNEGPHGHLTGSEFDPYGYGTGPLTGTLSGSKVEITNHQPVQYTGTWSPLGGMSGTWAGAGATGTFQLRRSGAQAAI